MHVLLMAVALALAAFGGGALGLIWQSTGIGQDEAPLADSEAAAVMAAED